MNESPIVSMPVVKSPVDNSVVVTAADTDSTKGESTLAGAIWADLTEWIRLEATRVSESLQGARAATSHALKQAVNLGVALTAVKTAVGHGNFIEWLEREVPQLSTRTARRYMQMAVNWSRMTEMGKKAVSISQVLRYGREKDPEVPVKKVGHMARRLNSLSLQVTKMDAELGRVDTKLNPEQIAQLRSMLALIARWIEAFQNGDSYGTASELVAAANSTKS